VSGNKEGKKLLKALPPQLREKAVKLAGGEQAASQLALKLLEQGLAELEEEEELQEALGELHAWLKRK